MFDPLYKDVAHIIVFTTFKNMPENLFKGIKYARVSGLVFRQDDKLRMIRGVSGRRFTSNHYALLFDEKNSTTLVDNPFPTESYFKSKIKTYANSSVLPYKARNIIHPRSPSNRYLQFDFVAIEHQSYIIYSYNRIHKVAQFATRTLAFTIKFHTRSPGGGIYGKSLNLRTPTSVTP